MDHTPGSCSEPAGSRPEIPLPFRDLPSEPPGQPQPATDTVAAHEAKGQRRPPDTVWRRNPRDQG